MKQRARADKQAESPARHPRRASRPTGTATNQPSSATPDIDAGGLHDFDAPAFAATLERWFADHGRHDLPWRRTTNPYAILVSELMLQQTQVATVVAGRYLERWLEAFPDLPSLAAASEQEVLKAWEGLGYYRRARTLQRLARELVAAQGPQPALPPQAEALQALPGIGPYTAGAVASIAFGQRTPLVDGNVTRILARLFLRREPIDSTAGSRWCWDTAARLVAACSDPRLFNPALMELGQRICVNGRPNCGACPVRNHCRAAAAAAEGGGDPAELPVRRPRARPTEVEESVLWLRRGDRLLLQRIGAGQRREGLWQLPVVEPRPDDRAPLCVLNYGITRYRVRLSVFGPPADRSIDDSTAAGDDLAWLDSGQRARVAIAAPYLKAIRQLLCDGQERLPGL